MKVLITGASGFIGTHLCDFLKKKNVRFVELKKGQPALSDEIRLASLIRRKKISHIFHLAGIHGKAPEAELMETNVAGTAGVLNAVARSGKKIRTVVLSSSAVYGNAGKKAIAEKADFRPLTPYGASKAAMDLWARQFFLESQLPIIRVRPFNVIGPGQNEKFFSPVVARQIVKIENGRMAPEIQLKNLGSYRDFVDVRDVVRGLYLLAVKGKPGEAYNLCSGRATPIRFVPKYMISQSNRKIKISEVSDPMPKWEVAYQRGSFAKAKKDANWRPQISLKQSLNDILAFWRMKKDTIQ